MPYFSELVVMCAHIRNAVHMLLVAVHKFALVWPILRRSCIEPAYEYSRRFHVPSAGVSGPSSVQTVLACSFADMKSTHQVDIDVGPLLLIAGDWES